MREGRRNSVIRVLLTQLDKRIICELIREGHEVNDAVSAVVNQTFHGKTAGWKVGPGRVSMEELFPENEFPDFKISSMDVSDLKEYDSKHTEGSELPRGSVPSAAEIDEKEIEIEEEAERLRKKYGKNTGNDKKN